MADKALDTLYIAYKSSGIDKVRKDLREVLASVKETQRKINALLRGMESPFKRIESASLAVSKIHSRFAKQLESATANYKAQEKSLRQISNLTKGLKGAKITVTYKNEQVGKNVLPDNRDVGRGGDSVSAGSSSIPSYSGILYNLARLPLHLMLVVNSIDSLVKSHNNQRKANQQFYNAIKLSGLDAKTATNAAANIQRYGGDAGDVLASSNSISASLGAFSRGDTSLIEHLARFGIGGIMPNMTPAQVQNIIKRRLSSGQLNANEVNALFAGLPYSNAEKISMLEGNDLYKGNLKAFQVEEENRNLLYAGARAQISLLQSWEKFLARPYVTEGESAFNALKEKFPNLFIFVKEIKNIFDAVKEPLLALAVLKTLTLEGIKKAIAEGVNMGIHQLLNGAKTLAKSPLTYGAALSAFVGWEGYKAIKSAAEVPGKIDPKMSVKEFRNRNREFDYDVDRLRYKLLSPQEFFKKYPNILKDEEWMKIYNRSPSMNQGYFPSKEQSPQPAAMNVTINVGSTEEAFNIMGELSQRGVYDIGFMESALI